MEIVGRHPNGVSIGDLVVRIEGAELPWLRSLLSGVLLQSHEGSAWEVIVQRHGHTVASRRFADRKTAERARTRLVEDLRRFVAGEVDRVDADRCQSMLDGV
jgi:hypothetical protein